MTTDRALRAASVRYKIVDPRSDVAQRALARYFAELDARFRTGFDVAVAGADAVDTMAAPDGAFVVVLSDETLVGCGGVQHVVDDTAEIKRMWIDDAWRRLGLGGRLLRHLELVAADLGRDRVVLDTNEVLLEAITMYQRAGYHAIERYNDSPYAHHWFAKEL